MRSHVRSSSAPRICMSLLHQTQVRLMAARCMIEQHARHPFRPFDDDIE